MADARIIAQDLPVALALIKDITQHAQGMFANLKNLEQKIENNELNTDKGISFLEVKFHLLLSYLINRVYVVLKKLHGEKIEGDGAIDRLVEIRTFLERMKPIDQKLKYQIDKLVRLTVTGSLSQNDPLRFKANPDNLMSKLKDGESDEMEEQSDEESHKQKEDKPKLYIPPKVAAVHYDGDETIKDKKQKQTERNRKRALNSSIMRDLREEYYDGPEEVMESYNLHRMRDDKETKRRTQYEEDFLLRLNVSKKKKHDSRRMATISSLRHLTEFGDFRPLTKDGGNDDEERNFGTKRKISSKVKGKKGKKKGFKRKR